MREGWAVWGVPAAVDPVDGPAACGVAAADVGGGGEDGGVGGCERLDGGAGCGRVERQSGEVGVGGAAHRQAVAEGGDEGGGGGGDMVGGAEAAELGGELGGGEGERRPLGRAVGGGGDGGDGPRDGVVGVGGGARGLLGGHGAGPVREDGGGDAGEEVELELEGVGDVLAVLNLEYVLERLQTVGDEEEEALRTRLVVPEGDAGDGDGTQARGAEAVGCAGEPGRQAGARERSQHGDVSAALEMLEWRQHVSSAMSRLTSYVW